jgi:hypothetical protein
MDSIFPKDSNGILFVKFGLMKRKIWILQDWDQIWFEILIRICFNSDRATWLFLIGGYLFVWIIDEERQIKLNLDGSDLFVPFRWVNQIGPFDWDPMTEMRQGENLTGELGFWWPSPARVARWLTMVRCRGSWWQQRTGRGVEWLRDDARLNGWFHCGLLRRLGADGRFQTASSLPLIGCKFRQEEDTSMISRGRETFQCRKGGAGLLGLTGFLGSGPQW